MGRNQVRLHILATVKRGSSGFSVAMGAVIVLFNVTKKVMVLSSLNTREKAMQYELALWWCSCCGRPITAKDSSYTQVEYENGRAVKHTKFCNWRCFTAQTRPTLHPQSGDDLDMWYFGEDGKYHLKEVTHA